MTASNKYYFRKRSKTPTMDARSSLRTPSSTDKYTQIKGSALFAAMSQLIDRHVSRRVSFKNFKAGTIQQTHTLLRIAVTKVKEASAASLSARVIPRKIRTRRREKRFAPRDELTSKLDESRRVTLHVITDPGQSKDVEASFRGLVQRLDPVLDVICVSESSKTRNNSPRYKNGETSCPRVPAIGVLLFFEDAESSNEADHAKSVTSQAEKVTNCSALVRSKSDFERLRRVFSKKPWRFHHRVAVTGKLISCDSNSQDFYSYEARSTPQSRNPGRSTPLPTQAHSDLASANDGASSYPIWGVRKIHYGKQILRFNLFVSWANWEDQIKMYRLLLRRNEEKVRDDFCYFSLFSSSATAVQFALKKLPGNLQPQPLRSTVLQFQVKNVGQLVPLLPHSCEPISDLRWRTRDHDSNLILLQISRSRARTSETDFVEKAFSDYDSSASDRRQRVPGLLVRSKIRATRAPTPIARVSPICPPRTSTEQLSYPQPKPRTLKGRMTPIIDGQTIMKDKLRPDSRLAIRSSSSTPLPFSPPRGDVTPKSVPEKQPRRRKVDYFSFCKTPNFEKSSEGVFV